MAVAYVANASGSFVGSPVTITMPSYSTGDLVIVTIHATNVGETVTPPTGWSTLPGELYANPTTISLGNLEHISFYRFMQAGDSSSYNWGFSPGTGVNHTWQATSFSGVSSDDPFDMIGPSLVIMQGWSTGSSFIGPPCTTTSDGVMLYAAISEDNSYSRDYSPPTGWTKVNFIENGSNQISSHYRTISTAASVASQTFSFSSGFASSEKKYATFIGLRPASASGTTLKLFAGPHSGTPDSAIVQWNPASSGTWLETSITADAQTISDWPVTASDYDGHTGVGLPVGGNTSGTLTALLSNTPSNFASMDSLTLRYSTTLAGTTYTDDTAIVILGIFKSDGTTMLAGYSLANAYYWSLNYFNGTNWNTIGSTGQSALLGGLSYGYSNQGPPGYNKTISFTVDQTATKADWDTAVVKIAFADSRNMGSDSATIVLVDFELEGTYTPSGPAPTTVTPIGSKSSTTAGTAQLTVTTPPTTVTPVGSKSTTTSATAQLTVTALPTTITPVGSRSVTTSATAQLSSALEPPTTIAPVGSKSLSTSATAQLVSPGTPLAITDLSGLPGTNHVDLDWTAPVGVQ